MGSFHQHVTQAIRKSVSLGRLNRMKNASKYQRLQTREADLVGILET